MKKIGITTGDFNGIGAEITIKALNSLDLPKESVVIFSNRKIIEQLGKLNKEYEIVDIPFDGDIEYGQITKEAGEFSYQLLKTACAWIKQGKISGLVTAPTAKSAMHLAGRKYSGQTEILEKFLALNGQKAEMLFVANNFRVLLLTRHCALKDIYLTKDLVKSKIKTIDKFLKNNLDISCPKLALCAFNPHAGEDGILGNEEIEILKPAVNELTKYGISITEPLPADTLFTKGAKEYLENLAPTYDCYIANYHDQGLIPIKTVAGIKTVNMTIGLDVIRTSPGHGTAFDIAGKNLADEAGMISAINALNKLI